MFLIFTVPQVLSAPKSMCGCPGRKTNAPMSPSRLDAVVHHPQGRLLSDSVQRTLCIEKSYLDAKTGEKRLRGSQLRTASPCFLRGPTFRSLSDKLPRHALSELLPTWALLYCILPMMSQKKHICKYLLCDDLDHPFKTKVC